MSYDVDLFKELDGEPHTVFDVGNYTSNVADMWAKALGGGLYELHLQPAADWVSRVQSAVEHMTADPDEYRAMNPENGWGDYEGALAYLERLLLGCRLHPDAVIYVSH